MKCGQCGAELAKGEKFCRVCGAQVSVVEPEEKQERTPKEERRQSIRNDRPKKGAEPKSERKRRSINRKLIAVCAAVLAAAVAVVLIIVFSGGGSPILSQNADRPFVVVIDGVAGSGRTAALYSADGVCLDASTGRWQVSESVWNGTVAFLRSDGVLRIGTKDGCSGVMPPHVYTVSTSANGAKVAFISGYDGNTGDGGELYVYDVKNGDSTLIDYNVTEINAVSPGGGAISYTAYDKASDAYHVRISKNGKKGERLLDCEKVYALSDDSMYMCILNDGKIYSVYDGSRVRICTAEEMSFPMLFNADCTEMLYACQNDCRIARGVVTSTVAYGNSVDGVFSFDADGDHVSVMPVKKFDRTMIRFDGNKYVWYNAETNDPGMGGVVCNSYAIAKDGKSMYWFNQSIRYTKFFGDNRDNDLAASPDYAPIVLYGTGKLDCVYYTNARGELWQLKGKKTHMVSADVSNVCMGGDGVLYFVYDDVVLCRANGSERVSLERREGVTELASTPQGVVAKTTRDGAFYYRNGGAGVKLPVLASEITEG